jgi:hypothetical protein
MSRGVHTFRKSDLVKALTAARAEGLDPKRIEIDSDGKIVLIIGNQEVMAKVAEDARI